MILKRKHLCQVIDARCASSDVVFRFVGGASQPAAPGRETHVAGNKAGRFLPEAELMK